jgi:two-component system response regulator HydG
MSSLRKPSVLVVDDNAEMVGTLERYLADHNFEVHTATSCAEALKQFAASAIDVALTDLRMHGMDGLDVLAGIHRIDPEVPVVLMTAFGNIESAVDAIQRGAYQYVTKPFKMVTIRLLLQRAASERMMREQNRQLKAVFNERFAAHGLLGGSIAMRELDALIDRVAVTPSPVLIVGETGTGKELVARAIHVESARRERPFVAVNCAALPDLLLESELFGHVASALPNATRARRGLFAEADGGTLFLDEVANMPLPLQAKFLRVLQSGEIRPLGGETSRFVNVRCIASTHADLQILVRQHAFREDLFYRLNVVPIRVPPLRERREDIALLTNHFVARTLERLNLSARRVFSASAIKVLESYSWPGNVRELENVVERLVVTTSETVIDADPVRSALAPVAPQDPIEALAMRRISLDQLEERYIAAILRLTHGSKAEAANILEVDPSTLYRRAKQRPA